MKHHQAGWQESRQIESPEGRFLKLTGLSAKLLTLVLASALGIITSTVLSLVLVNDSNLRATRRRYDRP
ncbi:MAG: hypothetical protein WCL50_04855 [Spirochaetota bacterium]